MHIETKCILFGLIFCHVIVGRMDLLSMVQYLCLISCQLTLLSDYDYVWPDLLHQSYHRSLWPIFHGLVILPYIPKTMGYMKKLNKFLFDSVGINVWPLIHVCHIDLYFMVPWFCIIFLKQWDIWARCFGIVHH